MSSLLNVELVDATKVVVSVTLFAALVFTGSYLVRANWRDEPVGWGIVADRVAITLILIVFTVQTWWTFDLNTAEWFLGAEDALLFLTGLVMIVATIYMFRMQRRRRKHDAAHRQKH